jgi:hypothetical protein
MAARTHILVVNGRKVRAPVFVIGAPNSGVDLVIRTLKRAAGFHFTVGQPSVRSVVFAFARAPSIQHGRGQAAATVLRDAFAQGWQVSAHACLACLPACQQARASLGNGTCVDERSIARYGDASPELIFCTESLVEAFPDAKIVAVVRDGRDVVAAMLADPQALAWFRPGVANVDSEFPNPFFGIETPEDRDAWPELSTAGKCAMRWRGSVHKLARLRSTLRDDQLTTFRYEQLVAEPDAAAGALGQFIDSPVGRIDVLAEPGGKAAPGNWRKLLNPAQLAEIEKVAGPQLRRVGYGD